MISFLTVVRHMLCRGPRVPLPFAFGFATLIDADCTLEYLRSFHYNLLQLREAGCVKAA